MSVFPSGMQCENARCSLREHLQDAVCAAVPNVEIRCSTVPECSRSDGARSVQKVCTCVYLNESEACVCTYASCKYVSLRAFMFCSVALCCPVVCCAMLHCAMSCLIPCCAMLCHVMLCNIV